MRALAWYEVVGKNIGSVTIPYDELRAIAALLREKDAEIERLNKEVDRLSQVVLYHDAFANDAMADARAEAITEFAERAKRRLPIISPSVFDQIAKEMKGEENGESDL